MLLDADDVVIVDLTPEELQARLRAGKVYPAERVDAALLNFFTTANLRTLREVALREVAGAVDERIQRDIPAPGRRRAPRLAERVMVVARPERGAQRLVRPGVAGRPPPRRRARRGVPGGRASTSEGRRQRDLLREPRRDPRRPLPARCPVRSWPRPS